MIPLKGAEARIPNCCQTSEFGVNLPASQELGLGLCQPVLGRRTSRQPA